MSSFGDFVEEDGFDTVPPDADALARFILLSEFILSGDPNRPEGFHQLDPWSIALRIYVAARLIKRGQEEGWIRK